MGRNKDNDKNNVVRFPKEIDRDCPICGQTVTALPADIKSAMDVHKALAHG